MATAKELAVVGKTSELPQAVAERGYEPAQWNTLREVIFRGASDQAVLLAMDYCKARKLDPLKRPVHIVSVWDSDLKRMVETIWPGINELRTTAMRTGSYAGMDEPTIGPMFERKLGSMDVSFPEFAQVTVYRMIQGQRVPFAGPRVYWLETYAQKKRDDVAPNAMWAKRPRGQLVKCAEAAALRAAFPEELGDATTAEEMDGQILQGRAEHMLEAMGSEPMDAELVTSTPHAPDTGEVVETQDEFAGRGNQEVTIVKLNGEKEEGWPLSEATGWLERAVGNKKLSDEDFHEIVRLNEETLSLLPPARANAIRNGRG